LEGTKLELSKSPVLADVMSSLNVCTLCTEPVCIIFAEEDRYTVESTLDQLSVTPKEEVYLNNQDRLKVLALSIRLNILKKKAEFKLEKGQEERSSGEAVGDVHLNSEISEVVDPYLRDIHKRPLNPFRKKIGKRREPPLTLLDHQNSPAKVKSEKYDQCFHQCSPELDGYEDGDLEVNLDDDLHLSDDESDQIINNNLIKFSSSPRDNPRQKEPSSTNKKLKRHKKEANQRSESSKELQSNLSTPPRKVRIKCELCTREMLKSSIRRHERKFHGKNSCQKCGKKFDFKASLIAHELTSDCKARDDY